MNFEGSSSCSHVELLLFRYIESDYTFLYYSICVVIAYAIIALTVKMIKNNTCSRAEINFDYISSSIKTYTISLETELYLTYNLYNSCQHGFRKGRSCLSALLSTFDNMLTNISEYPSSQIDMIYLDFSKAFDKVDHGVLLHKMKDIGISGVLGKWMYEFLNSRKQQVRLKGGSSHKISCVKWSTTGNCACPSFIPNTNIRYIS